MSQRCRLCGPDTSESSKRISSHMQMAHQPASTPNKIAGVRSYLVHALVQLDREHVARQIDERWPAYYARPLLDQFG